MSTLHQSQGGKILRTQAGKSLRCLDPNSDSEPFATSQQAPAAPTSAARATYNVLEIRAQIFSSLAKSDLASCMLLERKGMTEVAKPLYGNISHNLAVTMKKAYYRQKIYCNAVREINAEDLKLSLSERRALIPKARIRLGLQGRLPEDDFTHYLRQYHADLVNIIVPPLRKFFPNLRRLSFHRPSYHRQDDWCISFPSTSSPESTDLHQFAASSTLGHIDVIRTIEFAGPAETFAATLRQSVPPSGYTLHERFNLVVVAAAASRDAGTMLRILREDARLGDIHKIARFGDLPITMTDIIRVYKRQIAHRHGIRLAKIVAHAILPWDISDFQEFATIAAHSLTHLELTNRTHPPSTRQPNLSFGDLSVIVSTIRTELPNLRILRIAMAGLHLAESFCQDALTVDGLDISGKLDQLRIDTSHHAPALFNTIRSVSSICSPSVGLMISTPGLSGRMDQAQTGFLHYLRLQPLSRRSHLAIADFSKLDAVSYSDVNDLEYHDDGRPRRLGETKSKKWHEATRDWNLNVTSANDNLETINAGLGDFTEMSDQLQAMSGTATTEKMLAEAERLRDVARVMVAGCAGAAAEVAKLEKQARGVADELEKYAESLKGIIQATPKACEM